MVNNKIVEILGILTKCTESRQTHIRGEDRDINNKHTYTLAIVIIINIDTWLRVVIIRTKKRYVTFKSPLKKKLEGRNYFKNNFYKKSDNRKYEKLGKPTFDMTGITKYVNALNTQKIIEKNLIKLCMDHKRKIKMKRHSNIKTTG